MTQKNPFALLTNLSVWLSGKYSPCRKKEIQIVTQRWVFNIDSKFGICWRGEKNKVDLIGAKRLCFIKGDCKLVHALVGV